jgi:NifB/MoaA-like Fe-S oxidoreductase
MRRINTLSELKAEQKRLKIKRAFLELEIKKEFKELKESLAPLNIIGSSAKKAAISENNHFLGTSAGNIADFIGRMAVKRSGIVTKLLVPFLLRNVAGNLVEKNKSRIVHWMEGFITKFTEKKTLTRQTFTNNGT